MYNKSKAVQIIEKINENKIYALFEMSKVCSCKRDENATIVVYSNDHIPPHCHVNFDPNKDNQHSKIKVKLNSFLPKSIEEIEVTEDSLSLSVDQKKSILSTFKKKNRTYKNLNNWKVAVITWNKNNPMNMVVLNEGGCNMSRNKNKLLNLNEVLSNRNIEVGYITDKTDEENYGIIIVVKSDERQRVATVYSIDLEYLGKFYIPKSAPRSIKDIRLFQNVSLDYDDLKSILIVLKLKKEFNTPNWVIANILWDASHDRM